MTGKARARHGSTQISSPSLKWRMCSWQVAVPPSGPCATPLIIMPHEPQMPSRQSCSKWIGSSPFSISSSLTTSSISRNDASATDVVGLVRDEVAPRRRATSAARRAVSDSLLVAPRRQLHFLVHERLLVQHRLAALALVLPRGDVEELVVVALAPRRPASGTRRGSGRRTTPRDAARRCTSAPPSSKKSATRPAFSSD